MIESAIQVAARFDTSPAARFVQTASQFSSHILIKSGNKTANAKSIMGVISLAVSDGQTVTVVAEGEDEERAVPALAQFLRSGAES